MTARRFTSCLAAAWLAVLGACGAAQAQTAATSGASTSPQVGVFYFPGWKDDQLGGPAPRPWERLKRFPERKPLLGWYDEGRDDVMGKQLEWMSAHGIRFIVFDAFWLAAEHQKPMLDHALKAYLRQKDKRGVRFALMWANHSGDPRRGGDFYSLINHWIAEYLKSPDYLRIDGRPAVFIQLGEDLDARARAFGSNGRTLLDRAQATARAAGLPGLYFVGGAWPGTTFAQGQGSAMGYSAYFAYNYHAGIGNRINGQPRESHSYAELDQAYRQNWQWFIDKSDLPYIVPATSGWDKRPWGGSPDPKHDNSLGKPAEFRQHLQAARALLLAQPAKTLGMTTICCWNEFGEGSYIEPADGFGMGYLEAVRDVFGR